MNMTEDMYFEMKEPEEIDAVDFNLYMDGKTQDRWDSEEYYQEIFYSMRNWMEWFKDLKADLDSDEVNNIAEKTMDYIDLIILQSKERWSSIYLVDDFIGCVVSGEIMDDDGEGLFLDRYGNELSKNPGYIHCDANWINEHRHDFPFIKWFNR